MSAVTAIKVTTKLTDSEFDQLFREHHEMVYRTAYSITRNAEDAEDVLQTIFLSLVRREFPPDLTKNPKAYFYRAAFNRALDIARSRQREARLSDAARPSDFASWNEA